MRKDVKAGRVQWVLKIIGLLLNPCEKSILHFLSIYQRTVTSKTCLENILERNSENSGFDICYVNNDAT